jgi:hypothetical protein
MAELHIYRIARLEYYIFPFKIWIDGKKVARVLPDQEIAIPLDPGKHLIQAKIFYHRSKKIQIDVSSNDEPHYMVLSFNFRSASQVSQYFEMFKIHLLKLTEVSKTDLPKAIKEFNFQNKIHYIRKNHPLLNTYQATSYFFVLTLLGLSLFYPNPDFITHGRDWLFFWAGMGIISNLVYFNLNYKQARTRFQLFTRIGAEASIYIIIALTLWDFPLVRYLTLLMAASILPFFYFVRKVFSEGKDVVYG